MSHYFLDTSGVVKRYITETGRPRRMMVDTYADMICQETLDRL